MELPIYRHAVPYKHEDVGKAFPLHLDSCVVHLRGLER
jgi:hypothetical protein